MELFDKYTWIVPFSATLSLWFVFFLYQTKLIMIPFILIGIMLCSAFSFPCIFRSILCFNWQPATAMVTEHNDLSRFHINDAGSPSFNIMFELDLEYIAGSKIFKGKVIKHEEELSFLETIYFNPKNPTIYTYRKGMTWISIGLVYDLIVLLILGYMWSR